MKIYLTRVEFNQVKSSLSSAEYWHVAKYSDDSCAELWHNLSSDSGSEDQIRLFDRQENIIAILATIRYQ